ncbi:Tolloid-like protein 2 [Holothuria leucospilota]|uniref:Tolloid-like protein 2 n=1 Tax=Holothuria leucospilota TaxID=206669 RepID=A0A9Q1BT98_HOLLE|nr:Tolloid-like protein 2 [Holothuria leucospilota]
MEEGSSNLVKGETKLVYTMLLGDGYSTTTKRIFLCFFLLINVTMQQTPDEIIYLRDPSGEFTSPEYPDTPSVYVAWNITVDKDHRILLQFLDFELVERNPCSLDDFQLYDSAFAFGSLRGRWCWDSFDKLNPITYISSGNIFLLRLRTVQGYSRKGFKANYSSIPKEATTTNTLDVTQRTTTTEVLEIHSTSTRNVPKTSPTTNVLKVIPTTTPGEKLPGLTKSSAQTETTNVSMKTSPTSELPRSGSSPGIIVVIATSLIVAFIVIFIAALIVWKYKMNNLSNDSSNDETSKASSRGNISTEMYEVVKEEDVHDIKSNYENTNLEGRGEKSVPTTDISMNVQQLKVYSKEIVREGDLDTPDGTYETPDVNVYTYADPNEMKFCVTK